MNCIELFTRQARSRPGQLAVWVPGSGPAVTFAELLVLATRAQTLFRAAGVKTGDHVLMVDHLGPRLYASVTALLGLGACVVLVEPWMPIAEIERVVQIARPKLFLTNTVGKLWGLRVPAVRAIPQWAHPKKIHSAASNDLIIESMGEDEPGILTFTSGTTGKPKGVVRNQGYLLRQHRVISARLELEKHSGPDLCIFANFALANLGSGRGSIVVAPGWRAKNLRLLDELTPELRPESLTCGPAFLLRLMEAAKVASLKSVHVGGALTDCWILEKAFAHFSGAHFTHVYGSSEAEPVAIGDGEEAVRLSRARGLFQTLHLGRPVPEIAAELEPDGAWVTGPHVCPKYLANDEENRLNKRADEAGRVWHSMGDRVREDGEGWWYSGRSAQNPELFELEQRLYAALGSSKAFVQTENGEPVVCIADARRRAWKAADLIKGMKIYDVKIRRDRRHRARIDRAASWKTRKLCRIG